MKRSLSKYLEDIKLSIGDIQKYTAGVSSEVGIEENEMLFDALCRRFAIIGEAVYQADKLDPNLAITDKHKIKGLRHIIVHDYDSVRAKDLWLIIKNSLPTLNLETEELLKRFE